MKQGYALLSCMLRYRFTSMAERNAVVIRSSALAMELPQSLSLSHRDVLAVSHSSIVRFILLYWSNWRCCNSKILFANASHGVWCYAHVTVFWQKCWLVYMLVENDLIIQRMPFPRCCFIMCQKDNKSLHLDIRNSNFGRYLCRPDHIYRADHRDFHRDFRLRRWHYIFQADCDCYCHPLSGRHQVSRTHGIRALSSY